MNKKISLSVALFSLLLFGLSCASGKQPQAKGPTFTGPNYVTNITPVPKDNELDLIIEGSGKLYYTVFKLENPMRLIVDMPDMDSSAFAVPMDLPRGVASRIATTYAAQTGSSRIEVFLNVPVLYNVTRLTDKKILVSMKPLVREREVALEREIKPGEIEVTSIELREVSGLARILISYTGDKPVFRMTRKPEMNRIVIDIENSKVKINNEKLLSVERKDSLVQNVALFQFTIDPPVVKVVANLNEFTSSNVFEREGKIIFDIGADAILAKASEIKEEKKEEVARDISVEKRKLPEDYMGRKITLDFQDANIKNILRIIADVSGLNIITSENVQGKVTMKLKDVPWDLALDTILMNNKLGMVKTGNIIRVATQDELAREKEAQATGIKTEVEAETLFLKVFQINYESADKLKANLDSIKSSRGSIDINSRTNTLIVQDIKGRLAEMERLIEILDKRTVQVLIEARIVEVTHTYAKELGIRWGGHLARQTSLGFPSTIGLSGVSGGATTSAAGGVVDLGVTAATGAIGLRLGSVNSTALLDMQLSALETMGKGRILSMPKITTMDNVEALIESGREIPYQTTSSEGTKTEFKKATLSLKVTPHVSPDNYIRLEIEAKKDEADFANQLPNAPPPILTKHAKTVVLIKDGDTTVIGGLFKENKTQTQAGVPFFSKIPFLGWLFKSKADARDGEELLIFITPKIL
jgi:type IV pilus assembly protein PilQ